jgi:hypothetical protein
MKKKHFVIAIYFLYIALLFVVCAGYDLREEKVASQGFKSPGESIHLIFSFIAIAFLISIAFLITAYSAYKKFSFLFIIFAPFFTAAAFVLVGVALNFIFWITQLEQAINDFQKFFIIATISSMTTMIWLLRDIFTDKSVSKKIVFKEC